MGIPEGARREQRSFAIQTMPGKFYCLTLNSFNDVHFCPLKSLDGNEPPFSDSIERRVSLDETGMNPQDQATLQSAPPKPKGTVPSCPFNAGGLADISWNIGAVS